MVVVSGTCRFFFIIWLSLVLFLLHVSIIFIDGDGLMGQADTDLKLGYAVGCWSGGLV